MLSYHMEFFILLGRVLLDLVTQVIVYLWDIREKKTISELSLLNLFVLRLTGTLFPHDIVHIH